MLFVYVVSPFVQYLSRSLQLPIPCKVVVILKKNEVVITTDNIYCPYKTYFMAFSEGGR